MKASKRLQDYVAGRNRIRALFGNRPLSLARAQDRQQLAQDIDCSLSPENLSCDGELPRSVVQKKWVMLTKCAQELQKMDPSLKFYEA
jgi:hypothetical protein